MAEEFKKMHTETINSKSETKTNKTETNENQDTSEASRSSSTQGSENASSASRESSNSSASQERMYDREVFSKKYTDIWNTRYGSTYMIAHKDFAKLLPEDHEPDEEEMERNIETYLKNRPQGIWARRVLSWLFPTIIRRRVRSLNLKS